MVDSKTIYCNHTEQYIKREMKLIEETLLNKLAQAKESGAIPDEWMKSGNNLLKSAIIDSFCIDRPYEALGMRTRNEAANLHRFL